MDLLIKLPWKVSSKDNEDIPHVKEVLDEDHYGLEKQKDRILEYLAVKTMTKSLKAPILCLYGPPGVGKTSLAISVAKALNRKFVKFALGGIYDESEIRGHRRTYIGALPGRIITGIANAGTNNPVFLLDEIDKVSGGGIHGDPAAALLELLDPEQNINFEDNYLAMPFDLSNVLFICTANDISQVPAALRDRLELIELNTYTLFEKMNIAKKHLLKQEYELNGLNENLITFEDDAIEFIIDGYTREAGVRELRRKISTIMRKFSVKLLSKEVQTPFVVTKVVVEEFLNKPIFHHTRPLEGQVGIVNGLAYTSFGGEILPIECNITEGTGQLIRTGNLGDVMKESMQIAFSYVQELAQKYGYGYEYFSKHNFHIHCPEGAVPKDGPSAGVALSLCLLSAITGIPVSSDVAMTGEVDLRGRSMPIGGLREKTLAAVREHMRLVLIPKENHNDYLELPDEVKNNVEIKEVESVEDVVKLAFVRMPEEKAVPEQKKRKKLVIKLRDAKFLLSAVDEKSFLFDRPQVVFMGRSNAGKSSLVNAICDNKNLMKVSKTAGRTRQMNYLDVDGVAYLVDAPGYGFAGIFDFVHMLSLYFVTGKNKIKKAYFLFDPLRDLKDEDYELIEMFDEYQIPYAMVFTKIDRLNKKELNLTIKKADEKFPNAKHFYVSSSKKIGLEDLRADIAKSLSK